MPLLFPMAAEKISFLNMEEKEIKVRRTVIFEKRTL